MNKNSKPTWKIITMSDLLKNILEKYKKVEGGYLDPQRSGADGSEDDFIGKHIDNVEVTDSPSSPEGKQHKATTKMAPRKKHRKGYEPGEDADVYESADFIPAETLKEMMNSIHPLDEEDESFFDSLSLEESNEFFTNVILETVNEFYEEEASEEERQMIEEMLSSEEGYEELLSYMFESEDEDEEDDDEEEEDDDDEDEGGIDDKPKLKKEKYSEEIERRADVKMTKVKTPDGKVVYRKQRPEIKIGD